MQYQVEALREAIRFNTVETLPNNEEQLTQELTRLVELTNKSGEPIRHYIGFEISGLIHLGTGLASGLKIKKLTDAGVRCSIYLANYHAWLNGKLDGKMDTIEKAAREYFAPVMRECFKILNVNLDLVDFVFASDLIKTTPRDMSYFDWELLVSKELTLNRVLKSMSIMGKEAGDGVEFASLRYPPMQCTDAFFMGTHLVHAGLDQRKVHVLMREVANVVDDKVALKLGGERVKPIAIHHALLLGLSKPESEGAGAKMDASMNESNKMSKSKPDSAIWVHDTAEEIARKLKAAYCPMPRTEQTEEERVTEQSWNPLLNWAEKLLYPAGQSLTLIRKPEHGGDKHYSSYPELYTDYLAGNVHPMDLKAAFTNTLTTWLSPIRDWAEENQISVSFIRSKNKNTTKKDKGLEVEKFFVYTILNPIISLEKSRQKLVTQILRATREGKIAEINQTKININYQQNNIFHILQSVGIFGKAIADYEPEFLVDYYFFTPFRNKDFLKLTENVNIILKREDIEEIRKLKQKIKENFKTFESELNYVWSDEKSSIEPK